MLAANRPWRDLLWILLLRYPHDVLLPRAWDLQQNLTDHDAVYVALAEALEMPLLTLGREHRRRTWTLGAG
jgi:predicted nucleic acid-binding protein